MADLTPINITTKEQEKINLIDKIVDDEQVKYISNPENKRFQQLKETIDKDTNIKYEVHEFLKPDQSIGYKKIYRKIDANGDEWVKIVGEGVDAKENTHDWTKVIKLEF